MDNKDVLIEAQKTRIKHLEQMLDQAVNLAHYLCTWEHPQQTDGGKPAHRSVEEAGVANRQ